jgi:antitoxin CptB
MNNKENIKKLIIYRSTHRGTKEMDLILGNFVKKYINQLDDSELKDLEELLLIEDEILLNFYFSKVENKYIRSNKITKMFKEFKM